MIAPHTGPGNDAAQTADYAALGKIIRDTSRADEGTISATGANIVAKAVLASPWLADLLARERAKALREAVDLHLARARAEANRAADPSMPSTPSSPDERTIPSLLAGVLDALVALNDRIARTTLEEER